jgi:hypothetical protein
MVHSPLQQVSIQDLTSIPKANSSSLDDLQPKVAVLILSIIPL